MPFDPILLSRFPTLPGVYLMKDAKGKVLYIGKAKNLRTRVRQYFLPSGDGRQMVPYLTAQVEQIDTVIVDSETEALILENNLIKQHRPKYNALLKDDKTFFSLMVNRSHSWPMVRVVRFKGEPQGKNLYFGPYAHGHAARQTLEFLRRLFPLRQCSDRELVTRSRPCILYSLKRCIAPCVGKCSQEEYGALVEQTVSFLKGSSTSILKALKAEMEQAAEKLEFERAGYLLRQIQFIERTLEKQKVEIAQLKECDVIALYREGNRVALCQLLFREGKLLHSHPRFFAYNAQSDEELLSSFLLQTYGAQNEPPQEILLPLDLKDKEIIEEIISKDKTRPPILLVPKKGNKRALIEMAVSNAKARFMQEKEEKGSERLLMQMEELLHLINYPEKIECFDNSNISGSDPVSAMVLFTGGEKETKSYRTYRLKGLPASDDYAALREVLMRRYSKAKEQDNLPDLILIDGGKGHLNVALGVLFELDICTVDCIALAKEKGKHDKGMTAEQIFLPNSTEPLLLPPHSALLFFLQRVRDEAHRFALTYQRKRRSKTTLKSALDALPGIGPIKKKRLLTHFGSVKKIYEATPEEWSRVQGINKKDIETLSRAKEDV